MQLHKHMHSMVVCLHHVAVLLDAARLAGVSHNNLLLFVGQPQLYVHFLEQLLRWTQGVIRPFSAVLHCRGVYTQRQGAIYDSHHLENG